MRRFESVGHFLAFAQAQEVKTMVAVEMTETSLDIGSEEALSVLREPGLWLVMGAEAGGVDSALLARCANAVEIPALSASINVACAFMAALTAMVIADGRRGGGG